MLARHFFTCVAAVLFPLFLLFAVRAANAVYVDGAGVGQALLFPYYTVRADRSNAYNTYISIANTASSAVVAKVRFREGRNSRLVAEFNLYLGRGDMWTAALVPDGDGTRLLTSDGSCTAPIIPVGGFAFSNSSYASGDDQAGTTLDRTKEGHFEVIEMATLPSSLAAKIYPGSGEFDCSAVQGNAVDPATLSPPSGGLTGTATFIDVNTGLDVGYVPDALSALTSVAFYSAPGQAGSDFDSPEVDPVSQITSGNTSYRLVWNRGIDAVNDVLASLTLENEFVLDSGTGSRTDWVVTFPTRRFFVTNTSAQLPFTAPFVAQPGSAACEWLGAVAFTREGYTDISFAPPLPGPVNRLCWSSNVIPIRHSTGQPFTASPSDVLYSTNTPSTYAIAVPSWYENGRIQVTVGDVLAVNSLPPSSWVDLRTGATGNGAVQVTGMPAIGFMVRTFSNVFLSCGNVTCLGNYASAFGHRRIQRIVKPFGS